MGERARTRQARGAWSAVASLGLAGTLVACGLQVSGNDAAISVGGDGGGAHGGDGSTGGDLDGSPVTQDDGSVTPGDDASSGGTDATPPAPTLVYPMTTGTLYSFDVTSHLLKKLGTFTGCNNTQLKDIAVDPTGKIWGIDSAGLYQVAGNGSCTGPADFDATDHTYGISFPPPGKQGIYAVHDDKPDLFRIELAGGGQATVQQDFLPDDAGPDLVCSSSKCWAVLGSGQTGCAGGNTDCIYGVNADGSGGALVGSIAGNHKDVNGLAYAKGNLYAFCGNGDIVAMPAASPGQASLVTPTLDPSVSAVPGWQGAGSTSAEP